MLKKIFLLSLVAALTACGGDDNVGPEPLPQPRPAPSPPPTPTPEPAPVTNLVNNGDIENATVGDTGIGEGVAGNWNLQLGGDADATYTVVDSPVHGGEKAIQVEVTAVGGNVWEPQASNNFQAPVGTFTASAWVDGTPGATVNFIVQLPVDPWTRLGEQSVTLDDTEGEFQEITFDITSDAEQQLQAAVHVGYPENAGATVVFDDIAVLAEGVAAPTNLVSNAGFESGNAGDTSAPSWSNQLGAAATVVTVVNTPVREGQNALQVNTTTVGANPWEPQVTNTFNLESGTYMASAWVDGPSGAQVSLVVQLPVEPWTRFNEQVVTLDANEGEYQQITFEFSTDVAVDDFNDQGQISLQSGYEGNDGTIIYWDDIYVGLPPPNSVSNGDFETGTVGDTGTGEGIVQGWNLLLGGDAAATYTLVDDPVQGGDKALEMAVTAVGALWEPQATNTFSLEAGTYIASAWVDGTPGTTVKYVVQIPIDPWSAFAELEAILDDTEGEFQQITFEFSTDTVPEFVDQAQLGLQAGYDAGATVIWDSVTITPASEPAE